MGFFNRKPKIIKEIEGGAWGCLVQQGVDVDTLSKEIRCVQRNGTLKLEDRFQLVSFLRVFKPREAENKGIVVTGWETFDEHPELLLFEGYLTDRNEAVLKPKRAAAK